jgi:hypothetical protein
MSTKLVKIDVPESLHRRIKTIAASKNKKICDYMLEVLEDHIPKYIDLSSEDDEQAKKSNSKTKAKSNIN